MSHHTVSTRAKVQCNSSSKAKGLLELAILLDQTEDKQHELGYFHTIREILQQPTTWLRTGKDMAAFSHELAKVAAGARIMVLTGSGSSEYASECVRLTLQSKLGIPVQTISGGTLLTNGGKAIMPGRPGLMISFARSGDSPESVGVVSAILATEPDIRHLVITCSAKGNLARTFRDDPRVQVVVLADETNDRSLVMTSSFTNMVIAAESLGMLGASDRYLSLTEKLSAKAAELLSSQIDTVANLARRSFARVVYLADGSRLGAARESALKMIEMTAGRVMANCETFLGLRHGPMSAVHRDTLVVCCLASDPLVRAYECDLIRELNEKRLGLAKLIFGENIPHDLKRDDDVIVDCNGLAELGDENMPVLDILFGQLLAFFRCLKEGLKPDAPSASGIINRVVQEFTLHNA